MVVMVVTVVISVVISVVITVVVTVVWRHRGGVVRLVGQNTIIVSVLWRVVNWLLRIAEPWSVAQGTRFEYLRDGVFYEVAVRRGVARRGFVIILVAVARFVFSVVIILIFIIMAVFTGRETKPIAVTRMVLVK